ncbi:hypothetical protein OEZ86_009531 [Tetradesmus obliquus]|uniref:Uncharacterized protein n=1 Tax=Tetradesmus obliquus TaxID=3088 RepID=A0ABY8ULX6_TETOB|nr:hypothetical protein OEZ85_000977 [Tetradesmus obliquus]WIA42996.1 hypothetical protein OEZ86_009531 [Tetradesmus obliquus]
MAATQQSAPAVSYKEKLLQPSEQDELSHPDQEAPLPKLPPVKDEGSPPMTINVPAPAPAGEDDAAPPTQDSSSTTKSSSSSTSKPWSPRGNTQSPIDARFKVARSASGKRGVPKADYEAPILREGSASCAVQPQNVDDYPSDDDVPPPPAQQDQGKGRGKPAAGPIAMPDATTSIAGAELSDVEREAIADPTTAELLAAATAPTDAPAITPLPPANTVIVDDTDNKSASTPTPAAAAAAGGGSSSAAAGSGEGAAVDESAGESKSDNSAHSAGLGDVLGLGMPIMVRRIITAPSDAATVAAAMNAAGGEDADADRNAPGKAQGMAVTPRGGDSLRSPRRSTDSSSSSSAAAAAAAAADGELAEGAGGDARMFTASDFAAAGLADLTAEADAAGAAGGAPDASSPSSSGNNSGDDDAAPAAAAAEDEAAGASAGGDAAGPAAESYGHLMQAPAAAGDAAAVPAPATPENEPATGSSSSSGGVVQQVVDAAKSAAAAASDAVAGGSSESAAAAAAPAAKEAGSGFAGAVGAVVEAGKSAMDSAAAAINTDAEPDKPAAAAADEEEESGGSHHGGITGAVGAVMSGLKDVLLGPDVPLEAVTTAVGESVGEEGEEEGDGGALGQAMQSSAQQEGQPSSFAVL